MRFSEDKVLIYIIMGSKLTVTTPKEDPSNTANRIKLYSIYVYKFPHNRKPTTNCQESGRSFPYRQVTPYFSPQSFLCVPLINLYGHTQAIRLDRTSV